MEKICKKCNVLKNIDSFSKQKTNKDGYKNNCKKCIAEYGKKYRKQNLEKERERVNNYYKQNKLKRLEYFSENRDKKNEYARKYYVLNKDVISEKYKKYYQSNKNYIIERNNKYYNHKIKSDPFFKLKKQIKGLIRDSLRSRGIKKSNRTHEILGCSIEEFKVYLESKFEPWMNWDNKGLYNGEFNYGWDIDHIIPTSSANTEEELIKLNHYTNLQPLCSYHNRHIKRNLEL
jgi:hypothetical protein